ncbi:MAG: cytochrome P450 [Chloroflexi bacterium]|nr:cytochrome P450 [Chloroflexota bacterium]
MTTSAFSPNEIDLLDPKVYERGFPHDQWKLLRREAPVFWHRGVEGWFPGFWAITKYDDIMTISRDPATYISSHGIIIGTTPENAGPEAGLGKMMIVTDPPRHVRLRRLVNKGFTPRAVNAFEPHVRQMTTDILDGIAQKGRCDFVTDVAAILPLAVICGMMGVPKEDWAKMFDLTNRILGATDPEYQVEGVEDTDEGRSQGAQQTVMQGYMEMFQYFMRMLGEHKHERKEDLIGILVESEIDGEKLTDEEILYFAYLLILAGNETTRNATSGGLNTLFEHPEQKQRLIDDPSLIPSGVEEILRWISPVMHMTRAATRDVELRGQQIKTGDKLALWYPSANRDEDIFPNADTFDVGRTPNDHIAFGIGEHFCLGAGFARLELRVMFEELLRRFPDIEPDGPIERLRSNFIGGIKHMPVRFTPSA